VTAAPFAPRTRVAVHDEGDRLVLRVFRGPACIAEAELSGRQAVGLALDLVQAGLRRLPSVAHRQQKEECDECRT